MMSVRGGRLATLTLPTSAIWLVGDIMAVKSVTNRTPLAVHAGPAPKTHLEPIMAIRWELR